MVFRWTQEADGAWVGVDGPTWYRIRREGERLDVETNGDAATLRTLFQLDRDARAIEAAIVAAGPELEPYIALARGLRVLRYADPVECTFTFLCTANNHVARIAAMVRRLATYGDRFDGHHRFPDLARLAELEEAELRAAGFGYRGATLPLVARELLARGGADYLRRVGEGSLAMARRALVELPGIGPKLADCIALFGLGFMDAVPVDTHMWKVATRLYFPAHAGTALTPHKYEEFATFFRNRFGANAGWAHQALFFDSLLNWRSRKNGVNAAATAPMRVSDGLPSASP